MRPHRVIVPPPTLDHDLGEGQQLIAELCQPLQPFVDVEEAWLPAHRFVPCPAKHSESEIQAHGEVFRAARLHPNLGEVYRAKVAALAAALSGPDGQ